MLPRSRKKEHVKELHRHMTTDLRGRILDGRLPVGTRLPTDHELAASYQLSRDVIRQVLALLVDEGLVERIQGRGTFVCRPPDSLQSQAGAASKQLGLLFYRGMRETGRLFQHYVAGVEQVARLHNYSVTICYTEENRQQQEQDMARMVANHVAGLIVYPIEDLAASKIVAQLHASHFPLVFIDRSPRNPDLDYVGVDNRGGGYRGTEHLIILGHRRIGFIHLAEEGPETTASTRERQQGYREALTAYSLPYEQTLIAADALPTRDGVSPSITAFLQRPDRPNAIFAVNHIVALDVMQSAHALHLRIPEDLALVCFDDEAFSAHITPPLTTVAQPYFEIGWHAARLLHSRIEGSRAPGKHLELPVNLLIRDSCGMPLYAERIRAEQAARSETP